MGKLEELARLTAGNVQDSIGVGRPARLAERTAARALGPCPVARRDQEQERGRDPGGEDRTRSRPAAGGVR